ncbi:FHA domain-containing protein [Actinomadura sp. 3N508]|uniref:FHA domain-containing protein n=1 Tax=Actinomadura sp. 3N508 TaxID=3375153 RepID=UPI0037947796
MPEPQPAPQCPHCGTPRSGRFCEVDGYDFDTGSLHTAQLAAIRTAEAIRAAVGDSTPGRPQVPAQRSASGGPHAPASPGSVALITADRAYFDSVVALMGPDASALTFPPYCPERRVPLTGEQVRIGRRSASRGIEPEIDLSGPPEDPGVSHLHAVLLARPGGSWSLVDPGSTNGTTLNGGTDPIGVNVPVPVTAGDRIHVGAWTTITLQEGPP